MNTRLNPKFKFIVKGGVATVPELEKRMMFIRSLPDGEYEEIIRKPKKQRSNEQNRYFHGVIVKLISEGIGYSPDETKTLLKMMFLLVEKNGFVTCRETKDLSTVEQEEFNEHCRRWAAAELSINIPLPNEVDYTTIDEEWSHHYDANDC